MITNKLDQSVLEILACERRAIGCIVDGSYAAAQRHLQEARTYYTELATYKRDTGTVRKAIDMMMAYDAGVLTQLVCAKSSPASAVARDFYEKQSVLYAQICEIPKIERSPLSAGNIERIKSMIRLCDTFSKLVSLPSEQRDFFRVHSTTYTNILNRLNDLKIDHAKNDSPKTNSTKDDHPSSNSSRDTDLYLNAIESLAKGDYAGAIGALQKIKTAYQPNDLRI